jgi:hypothetical protein
MSIKKFLAGLAVFFALMPAAASAQIILSPAGQQQLSQLTVQLVGILNQLAQAQAQGTAYINSPAFEAQAASLSQQIAQIGQQLSILISTSAQSNPSPTVGASCPAFTRTLSEGMQGSDVAALQFFLQNDYYAQYRGSVNGYFDAATTAAVQRYQAGYGIVSYGSPNTTGYGLVGPGTRASINAVCARGPYVNSVPPIIVPSTGPNGNPNLPPSQVGYSTAQLSLIPSLTGQSGGPNSVSFSINMLPNSSCSAASFSLSFGDGVVQNFTSNASCANQIQTVAHVYPHTGQFTATLTSGQFTVSLPVNIQTGNNSISLTASANPNVSLSGTIVITYNPGTTCIPGTYTVSFGDNTSQNISFSSSCSTQSQTISHVFPQAGQYLITAADQYGRTVTATMTANVVSSAGAGDPFQVLLVQGEGANGTSAFSDSSTKAHSVSAGGSVHVDTSHSVIGNASVFLDGASYLTTPASTDFNYGTAPFTINLWFNAASFPATGGQAALLMQAGSNALDTSLGGAGLELLGNQLYFVGTIGSATYHPFYNNTLHTQALSTGTWYHAAAVRNNNTVTLYLNGVSQGSLSVSGAANVSTGGLALGRYGDFNGDYFNGWIDQVDVAKGIARWTGNFNPGNSTTTSTTTTTTTVPTAIGNDLVWSSIGPVANKAHCVNVTEGSDPYWTTNNYLCSDQDYGLQWSYIGPIAGLTCTSLNEAAASPDFAWSDNYLCSSTNYSFQWSTAGPVAGKRCTQINEPNEPETYTWTDNYLCYP